MENKKVLLLNAGHTEIPIIEELKKLGCYIITSGKRPDMPGHKLADKYICEDYSDKEAILKIAEDEQIDAIVSNAYDLGMVTTAYVAEKLGLPGHDSYENTAMLHQKDSFKELCTRLDIRLPKSKRFTNQDEAMSYLNNVSFPIMVKATDQASGVGINRAENYEEAVESVRDSFEKSKKKSILIEEFIEGTQQSFVAFVVNGKVQVSMSCNCYSPINPYLIQTETMPGDDFENLKPQLTEIVEKLFAACDLVDGLITIQYIVKNGQPYVIEMMRRCLGNRFLTPISAVTGFPWYKAMVMAELGMDCSNIEFTKPLGNYAGHHAIMSTRNGIYEGVEIPEDIMVHTFEYDELFEKGEEIKNYMMERMGYIYYTYDTREELDNAAKHFNENIILRVR